MDWTGGVRRRFAPGKSSATIRKQKAHFAKARSALQHSPSSKHSFRPTFYGKGVSQGRTPSRRSQKAKRRSRSRSPRNAAKSKVQPAPRKLRPESSQVNGQRKEWQRRDVIEITSSSVRTTLSSECGDGDAAAARSRTQATEPSKDIMNEEQRLLMANRRRLLAPTDWLGLSAPRPGHIKFRSHQDKDRIGKRRRVAESTSHKGQPATRRLMTPLFEDHDARPGYVMSGALQLNNVQVRIGTDALASQTQRSCHSQTPMLTTGRHPSTELGSLSEEPMLLGDEGDMFEVVPSAAERHSSPNAQVMPETTPDAPVDDDILESPSPFRGVEVAQMVQHQVTPEDDYDLAHRILHIKPDIDDSYGEAANMPGIMQRTLQFSCVNPDAEVVDSQQHSAKEHHQSASNARDDFVDEEAYWRRLMNFQDDTPSNPSLHAVKSSSVHVTVSESSHRPNLPVTSNLTNGDQRIASTPRGPGTQTLRRLNDAELVGHSEHSDRSGQSPSTSLKRIRSLAEQRIPTTNQCPGDADEDAIWRSFIIGSQNSCDSAVLKDHESCLAPQDDYDYDYDDRGSDVDKSFAMSGLGTSVKSTQGGTQHAGWRISPHHSQPERNLHAPQLDKPVENSRPTLRTFALRKDASETELDEIEDPHPDTPPRSKLAVLAQASMLNLERFKPAKRR